MSKKTTPFFCFPLCLLAFSDNELSRLHHICSHSVMRAGRESVDDFGAESLAECGNFPADFEPGREDHLCAVLGAQTCKVNLGSVAGTLTEHHTAEKFIKSFESKHGKSPLVFISTQLFWDCATEGKLSYRLFSLLCGVNSVLGMKGEPKMINRDMLIARQLGYKTTKEQKAALRQRIDGAKPLTTSQVRSSLDALEVRRLINRVQASARRVWFAIGMSDEDLREHARTYSGISIKSKIQAKRLQERELLHGRTEQGDEGDSDSDVPF